METIKSSAIRDWRGKIHTLPPPAHHKQILAAMKKVGFNTKDIVKGFWTSEERFVGREQAGRIAVRSGQAKSMRCDPLLHSGDMW